MRVHVVEGTTSLTGEAKALAEAALSRIALSHPPTPSTDAIHLAREIDAHAAYPAVQAHLLTIVSQFAATLVSSSDDAGLAGLRDGATDAVMRALRVGVDSSHAGVASSAFHALAHVRPQEPSALVEEMLHAVVAALRADGKLKAFASCERVAVKASLMLTNVISGHKRNTVRACDVGAVDALAAVMERFPRSEALHEATGSALHVCFSHGDVTCRTDAAAARAADAALAALRAFPAAPLVHKRCCLALSALIHDDDAVEMCERMMRAGCVGAFAATLRAHGADASLAEVVCLAIYNLGSTLRTSAALVPPSAADAALHAVTSALQTHLAHAPTQEFGVGALSMLIFHPHVAQRVAASSAALAAILAGMRAHRRAYVGVQTTGCVALSSVTLIVDDSMHNALGAAGAVGAAVGALRASTSSASRVSRALAAGSPHLAGNADATARCVAQCTSLAITALTLLCNDRPGTDGGAENMVRALHAGVLRLLQEDMSSTTTLLGAAAADELESRRAKIFASAARVAAKHVSQQPGCEACAALRTRGEMCSSEGCGACASAGSSARLQLCSRCMTAAYCCAEHQRKAWHVGHKAECAAATAAAKKAAAAKK